MTSANRVRLASIKEVTLGTTPNTPRMRTRRMTSETLKFNPEFMDSDQIRSDRMLSDPIKVMQSAQGGINDELTFPVDNSPLSTDLESAFCNSWTNSPSRDNDGTADSVITAVANGTDVATVTTGAAFVDGQLVRFSGFTAGANNGVFKCTTGSATVPAFVGAGFATEAAPPAAARMKVVGFQGASGDVTAVADGLGSTTLDFTTLGLAAGMWLKIGGTATGDKFATAACNGWARVTAVAANKITLDNLPNSWATDTGTGKTIKVWFGDYIKNGTTIIGQTIEKGFLGQVTPSYIALTGLVVNTFEVSMASRQKITYSLNYLGMGGSTGTTELDASPDAETTNQVFAGNANVGRLAEAGSQLSSPNWAKELSIQINNNLRTLEAVDSTSPVDIQFGECTVTGKMSCYFGSQTLLSKFFAGDASSINARVYKNSQAVVFDVPRVIYRGDGNPVVTGKNTDVMLPFDFQASYDSVTGAQITLSRLEYVEATS